MSPSGLKGDVPMMDKIRKLVELAEEIEKDFKTPNCKDRNFTINELVQKMISLTYDKQASIASTKLYIDPKAYAKEYCTIKFCLPRASGHTTLARDLHSNYFKNSIYLTKNHSTLDIFYKIRPGMICRGRTGLVCDITRGKYLGINPDAIIVDCTSLLSMTDIDSIYSNFCNMAHYKDNFIFLFLE